MSTGRSPPPAAPARAGLFLDGMRRRTVNLAEPVEAS